VSGRRPARVLIVGATGMLGHKAWQLWRDRFETWAAIRGRYAQYAKLGLFCPDRLVEAVDADDAESVGRAFAAARPEVVVNCVGIVKQLPEGKDPLIALSINAMFPHRLAGLCRRAGARLIHISTDCVFSGRAGNRNEDHPADADDLYGRTKLLGEPAGPDVLVLRTSIIGRELRGAHGLLEWLLGSRGEVKGFRGARFSGLTTAALCEVIAGVIDREPALHGLYHVAGDPIDKYDLLTRLKQAYRLTVEIIPDDAVQIDRSLNAERFRVATGWRAPGWGTLVRGLADDRSPYDEWRGVS
jgi:dTDP-4-dehydrorhamnose reductase